MYQNYNYYPQTNNLQGYNKPAVVQLKGRPVTSIEEAKASPIDFDGSVFFFPDLANHKIYTKQINMDGTATLLMYELKEMPIEPPNMAIDTTNFITRNEFNQALEQIRVAIVPKEGDKKTNEQYEF